MSDSNAINVKNTSKPLESTASKFSPEIPPILPHEKMYLIQIGNKLFRFSGASLSSDAPSYFTNYFLSKMKKPTNKDELFDTITVKIEDGKYQDIDDNMESKNKVVLFIDRDPKVFELIYNHLQGYFIDIKDEVEFTKLLTDAIYYNLPRLCDLLKTSDYYYTNIGGESFKISKTLFKKGNSPNYFDLTTGMLYLDLQKFFAEHTSNLIRPPPQSPPFVSRSPSLFKDLLFLLNGGKITMDTNRRKSLLRECRYYRFLKLEQDLIDCQINFNPFLQKNEILINLLDVKSTGVDIEKKVHYKNNDSGDAFNSNNMCRKKIKLAANSAAPAPNVDSSNNWLMTTYKRPYVDQNSLGLIFQTNLIDKDAIVAASATHYSAVGANDENKTVVHTSPLGSNAGTLFFDKVHNKVYVNFPTFILNKLVQVFQKVLSISNINIFEKYLVPSGTGSNVVLLPCCIALSDIYINDIRVNNIRSLLEDENFTKSFKEHCYNNELCGYSLFLRTCIWKMCIKNGELMMVGVKLDTFSSIREYHKSLSFL
ncbi:uncharacterized protein SCODWIG_00233 [Saccharomycodes ludwigii]|uniref:BTB domain-containing protein n=1 Tax=Saccharomycodes ludwigii TaxID=36035 RepID=A0A376B1F8_9ASCO|nr:hypothetical protein SCDLUD_001735 [Saccharomycodes ludwigii]KAH3901949.1 hypothetical protein SCDLUD_001735 [Saccharomycodes ludwigii]SSD58472.1 uncharacterized protein SCODWIG_00233 [Saccharomycodes ludwigii]